mmetsp:Transcript_28673/g.58001  ORF Transcript_28673/g.58001 Transcript_28673/m.58001 type:complete len:469 (+) Transcript_28673:143-1549(+)
MGTSAMAHRLVQEVSLPSLVDQGEEPFEDRPRKPDCVDLVLEVLHFPLNFLLVLLEKLLEPQLLVELLDHLFLVAADLALAVVLVKQSPCLLGAVLVVGMREEPAALLVLDVRPDLAELLGAREGVQVVVLGLKVNTHEQQGLPGGVVRPAVGDARDDHRQCHRQVEGVERGLVLHKQLPPAGGQLLQLAVRADRVQELAALGLEGGLQEEVHQPREVLFRSKVALEQLVNEHLHHQEVVGVQQPHTVEPVPTGIPAARQGSIHHVVGHKHASLQELHGPAQNRKAVQVGVRGRLALELHDLNAGLNSDEPAVHLAPLRVVLQGPLDPLDLLRRHLVQLRQLGLHLLYHHLSNASEGAFRIREVVDLGVLRCESRLARGPASGRVGSHECSGRGRGASCPRGSRGPPRPGNCCRGRCKQCRGADDEGGRAASGGAGAGPSGRALCVLRRAAHGRTTRTREAAARPAAR